MNNDVTGVVLAGGRSRRFGSNKALASWGDSTILQAVCRTVGSVFAQNMVVVKNKSRFPSLPLGSFRVVEDRFQEHHALGGLVTALAESATDKIFVCGCDTPLLQPELLHLLVSLGKKTPAVVPVWRDKPQPLCALYGKAALAVLRPAVDAGRFKLRDVLPALNPVWISETGLRRAGIHEGSFFDLDTRNDYDLAKEAVFGS